jgi:hypothetical protein
MKQDRQDKSLRRHLVDLLRGGGAHAKFDDVIKNIPAKLRGKKADGLPNSLWMLLEHMRIAQWDILEFSRNPKYASPKWPDDYGPKKEFPSSPAACKASNGVISESTLA